MKKILILAVAVATLVFPVPAQGSGSIQHKHHIHISIHIHLRKTKWDFLYKEFSDLRAEKGVALQGQNKIADNAHIHRALTQEDYNEKIADGELVKFPRKIDCVVVDSHLNLKPFLVVSAPQVIDYITNELAPALCGSGNDDAGHKPGGRLCAAYLEAKGDHFHIMVCPPTPVEVTPDDEEDAITP